MKRLLGLALMLGLLATLSAPTALALELAGRAGMMLAARSPDGIVFFGSDGEGRDGSA